jgi:tryptophan synthase beta subunit
MMVEQLAGLNREDLNHTGGHKLNLSRRGDKDLDFVSENYGYGE